MYEVEETEECAAADVTTENAASDVNPDKPTTSLELSLDHETVVTQLKQLLTKNESNTSFEKLEQCASALKTIQSRSSKLKSKRNIGLQPKDDGDPKNEKVNLLKKQLEENRAKLALREKNQKGIEEMVTQLRAQLNDSQAVFQTHQETKPKPVKVDAPIVNPNPNEKVISELNEKVQQLEEIVLGLKETVKAKDTVIDAKNKAIELMSESLSLKGESLKSKDTDSDAVSKQLQEMNKNMIKLKAQHKAKIKEMQAQIDSFKKMGDINQEIINLQNENAKLIKRLESEKIERSKNAEHVQKAMQSDSVANEFWMAQQEELLAKYESEKKKFQSQLEVVNAENKHLNEKIESLTKDKQDLNGKVAILVNENMELIDRLEKLSAEKVSSAESIEIVESLTQQEKLEMESLLKRNEKIVGVEKTEDNSTSNQQEIQELTEKIEQLKSERNQLMNNMEDLVNKNNDIYKKLNETEMEKSQLIETYEALSDAKLRMENQLEEILGEKKRLENEIAELLSKLEKKDEVEGDDTEKSKFEAFKNLEAEKIALEEKLLKISAEKNDLIQKLDEVLLDKDRLESENIQLLNQLKELKYKNSGIEKNSNERNDELEYKLMEAVNFKKDLELEIRNMELEKKKLIEQLNDNYGNSRLIDEQKMEIERLKEEVRQITLDGDAEKSTLEEKLLESQKMKDELNGIMESIKLYFLKTQFIVNEGYLQINRSTSIPDVFQEIIENHERQILTINDSINQLKEKLKLSVEENAELKESNKHHNSDELMQLQQFFEENHTSILNNQSLVIEKAKQIEVLEEEIKRLTATIHDLQASVKLKTEEAQSFKDSQNNEKDVERLIALMHGLSGKNADDCHIENVVLKEAWESLKINYNKNVEKLKKIIVSLKAKTVKCQELEAIVVELNEKIQAKDDEINNLNREIMDKEESPNAFEAKRAENDMIVEHLQTENENCQIKIQNLEDRLVTLQNEKDQLDNDLINALQVNEQYKNGNEANSLTIDDLNNQISFLSSKLAQFEEENESLQKERVEMEESMKKLYETNVELNNACQSLKHNLNELNQTTENNSELTQKVQNYEETINNLSVEVKKLTNDIHSMREKHVAEQEAIENEFCGQIELLGEERKRILEANELLNESKVMMEREITELKERLASIAVENPQIDEVVFEKNVQVHETVQKTDASSLITEIDGDSRKSYLCTIGDEAYQNTYVCSSEMNLIDSDENIWKETPEDVAHQKTQELQALKIQYDELKTAHASVDSELNDVKTRYEKLMRKLKEFKVKNDKLEAQLKKTEQSEFDDLNMAIEDELRGQIQGLEKKLKEMKASNDTLVNERESLMKQIDVLTAANERMVEMKERQDVEVERLKINNRDLQNKLSGLVDWSDEKSDGLAVSEVREHVDDDARVIAELRSEIDELNRTIADLSVDNEELQLTLTETMQTKLLLEKKLSELTQSPHENDQVELDQIKLENSNLKAIVDELKQTHSTLIAENQWEIEKLTVALNEAIQKIEHLTNEITERETADENFQKQTIWEMQTLFGEFIDMNAGLDVNLQKISEKYQNLLEKHQSPIGNDELERTSQNLAMASEKIRELNEQIENERLIYERKLEDLIDESTKAVNQRGEEIANSWKLHLQTREDEFTRAQTQLNDLISELNEKLMSETNRFQAEMTEVAQKYTKLQGTFDAEMKVRQEKDLEIITLKKTLQEYHLEIDSLNRTIQNYSDQVRLLTDENVSLKESEAQIQTLCDDLKPRVENLEMYLKEKDEEIHALQQTIATLQETIDLRNETNPENHLEAVLNEKTYLINQLEEERRRLIENLDVINREFEQAKIDSGLKDGQINEITTKVDGLMRECEQLRSELINVNNLYEQLQNDVREKEENNARQMVELENYKSDIRVLREQLDELNSHVARLTSEKAEALQSLSDIQVGRQNEIMEFNGLIGQYQGQIDNLQIQIGQLTEQLSVLSGSNEKLAELERELRENHVLIEQLNETINSKQSELNLSSQTLAQMESKIFEYENYMSMERNKYEEELNQRQVAVERISNELDALKHQLTECLNENVQLKNAIVSHVASLEEKERMVNELSGQLDAKNEEVNVVRGQSEKYEAEINQLNVVVHDLERRAEKAKLEVYEKAAKELEETREAMAQSTEDIDDAEIRYQLDIALYWLHQRDVRCEELTNELMQLLKERDTLQLKLSDSIKKYEHLRESPGKEESSAFQLTESSGLSEPSTLSTKLSELQTTDYSKDVRVKGEQNSRYQQQMTLLQDNDSGVDSNRSTISTVPAAQDDSYTFTGLMNFFWGTDLPSNSRPII